MKRQLKTGKNFLREFTKGFSSHAGYILQKADRIEGFSKGTSVFCFSSGTDHI